MSAYKNKTTDEVREIPDSLVAEWVNAGNPKADSWELYVAPPAPVAYSRQDYKRAIDAMLQAQCTAHEGYEFDSIESAATWIPRPNDFQAAAIWLYDLRTFAWQTSNALAKQPPSGTPPTPDEFAAYLLATFTTSNPFPQ